MGRERAIVWQTISRVAGLLIVFTILGLVVAGRTGKDLATIQILLVIAGGLLGLGAVLKRDGNGK